MTTERAPRHTRGFGSPTILIDGRDVMGTEPNAGSSCRIYAGSEVRGVPPLEALVAGLRRSMVSVPRPAIGINLAVLPGLLVSALPMVSCPACWPAYAGVVSALGVSLVMDRSCLLSITIGALLLSIGALAYKAKTRRGRGPLILGSVAAALIIVGRFMLEQTAVLYLGTALFVGASVWNSWPKKADPALDSCGCAPRSP